MKRKVNRKKKSLKQKFGFQEGGNVVDSAGYLDSNKENYSPYKVIPSNEITMKGVSENVVAFPFSKEGESFGKQLMKPDEQFKFDGADYVVEVPESELEKFEAGGYMDTYKQGGVPKFQDGSAFQYNPKYAANLGNFHFNNVLGSNNPTSTDADRGYGDYMNQLGVQQNDIHDEVTNKRVSNEADAFEQAQGRSGFDVDSTIQNAQTQQAAQVAQGTDEFDMEQGAAEMQAFTNGLGNTGGTDVDYGRETTKLEEDNLQVDIDDVQSEAQTPQDGSVDLFNPYGGFDIPTAAFTLGQGIEEGNTGKTIASGAKFLAGSARNFMSGLASQKRNQFAVDEYNQQQKDGLTKTTTLQAGGRLSSKDVDNINGGLDFEFSEEGANALFERRGEVQKPDTYQPNLGKYGEVGYFDVNSVDGDNINISTTQKNPHNAGTYKNLLPYLQEQNPNKNINLNYIPKNQEGGRALTSGDVDTINSGLDFEFSEEGANALFERRGEVQRPDSYTPNLGKYGDVGYFDVKSVNGDNINISTTQKNPHNAGTYKDLLPYLQEQNPNKNINLNYIPKNQEGGRALTSGDVDNINSKLDFEFSEEGANALFETRGAVSKPESYQPNLGKYGEVGYFNVDKVQGNVINLSTTSKNPHNSQTVTNLIPALKKMNPGKEIRINYVPKMQKGGKLNKILTDGYVQGIENNNFKQPNAEVEAGEYLDQGQGNVKEVLGKKHSQGGEMMQLKGDDAILSDHLKLGGANAKHFRDLYDLDVKAKSTYSTVLDKFKSKSGLKKLHKEKEELIAQIEKQKDIKDESTSGLNLQFLSGKLKEIEEKQAPLEEQMKSLFDETFVLQEASKPKEESSVEEYQEVGSVPKFQDGTRATSLSEVPEGQHIDDTTGYAGSVNPSSFQESLIRNDWYFGNKPNFDPRDRAQVEDFQKNYNAIASKYNAPLLREDGIWGEQTNSAQLAGVPTQGVNLDTADNTVDTLDHLIRPTPVEAEIKDVEAADEEGNRMDALLLPDQYPMPPDAMQPHLKNQRRFDRLDPNLISPEQQIEEINRNRNQVQKQLNQLPDNQRRAALATLNANTNNQINSAVSEVNKVNSQIKTQTDRVNLQQSNQEENFLATDALDFERRQLTALAKTQNDIRNYFNQVRKVQVGNFNTINDLNLINDMNSDFQFTGNGVEKTTANPIFTSDAVLRAQTGVPSLATRPTTPTKKKNGGTVGKRKIRRK